LTKAPNLEKIVRYPISWKKAAASAVERAAKTLRDLRITEVEELDMQINRGRVVPYRAKVRVSFKYEGKEA